VIRSGVRRPLGRLALAGAIVGAVVALWLVASPPALAQLSFSSNPPLDVELNGNEPVAIVASDFNHDSARDLATLWRTALGDRGHTRGALTALQTWVRLAERRADVAQALELLLPALVVTADDRKRLSHELLNLRAPDGGPRPPVADRLLGLLTPSTPDPSRDPSRS